VTTTADCGFGAAATGACRTSVGTTPGHRYHRDMSHVALLCTDGSELSIEALRRGLAVIGTDVEPVVVTVIDATDPMMVTGTGFAGGTMAADELANHEAANVARANELAVQVAGALGLADAGTEVLRGDPGMAICRHADEVDASLVVVGSRGRSGLRRAVLGSVSDYVVRHAPCPVLVTAPQEAPPES